MADFSALETAIAAYVKQNGNNAITGNGLQDILLAIVDAIGNDALNDLVADLAAEVTARQNADGALQDNIDAETTARAGADNALGDRITAIEGKIPSAATSSNQLADKAFVNAYVQALNDAVSAIQGKIPSEASDENQLADKAFVNALIAAIQEKIPSAASALNKLADKEWVTSLTTVLQSTINAVKDDVQNGYVYAGIAKPWSAPASGKVFYIATIRGQYTNFGNIDVPDGINILRKIGNNWVSDFVFNSDALRREIEDFKAQVRDWMCAYAPIVINGDVTNAPDEVDLTAAPDNLLKFKDKSYNPAVWSGLGKKYLRKNIIPEVESVSFDGFVENVPTMETLSGTPDAVFFDRVNEVFVGLKDNVYYLAWTDDGDFVPVTTTLVYMYDGTPYRWNGTDLEVDEDIVPTLNNILTQAMISDENTIYVIQYDFNLGGDTVTIPENCVLEFEGGSLRNGTLSIHGTRVITDTIGKPWDNTLKLVGTFDNMPKRDYSTSELGIPYTNSKVNRRIQDNNFYYTLTYHDPNKRKDNNSGPNDCLLYMSPDGFNYSLGYKLNLCDNPVKSKTLDYSFVFFNGTFYIVGDYYDASKPYVDGDLGGNNCICIYTSKDLLNFTCKEIVIPDSLRPSFRQAWAPDIFVFGNELYITVTSTDGSSIFVVPKSYRKRWCHNLGYVFKLNQETLEIDSYTTIVLPDNSTEQVPAKNWIDEYFFVYNSTWYLIVKDETNRNNKLYKVLNPEDLMSPNPETQIHIGNASGVEGEPIHTFNFVGEGASVAINGSSLYFYFDIYANSEEGDIMFAQSTGVVVSNNLTTFSNCTDVNVEDNVWNRHSSYKFSTDAERAVINTAIFLNGNVNSIIYEDINTRYPLANKVRENKFLPSPKTTYCIRGAEQLTIENIDKRFFRRGDRFIVNFETNQDKASLEIKSDNFYPKNTVFYGKQYKEAIIEFYYDGANFRCNPILKNVNTEFDYTVRDIGPVASFSKTFILGDMGVNVHDKLYFACNALGYANNIAGSVTFFDEEGNEISSKAVSNCSVCILLIVYVPKTAYQMHISCGKNASSSPNLTFNYVSISKNPSKDIILGTLKPYNFGDSIVSNTVSANNNTSFFSVLRERYQMPNFQYAIGGGSWTVISGRGNIYDKVLQTLNADKIRQQKLIFLSGGFNDAANGATIGESDTSYSVNGSNTYHNMNTLIGRIENCIATLFELRETQNNKPDIPFTIVYILTYPKQGIDTFCTARKQIREVCEKWGILLIDMADITGIISDDNWANLDGMFCDNTHPSEKANRLIADYVEDKIYNRIVNGV